MSKTIDQRVVEMQFDNRQFETGVATSMSTIDKLKQKLNFKDAGKGFESISSAAKKVDMNALAKSVDTVKVQFSSLQVVATTALANITNAALNAGKNIASSLTIAPVMSGFQEYETQMNAIQTILANTQSKGSTLEDVKSALNELNAYADQTIYNFTEMTRNIGTFTAAGVGLEESVNAIKGIANLAAVSGSNSTQAATAMYQLSQALAAGRVSLMDWNSVVNAGMGGEVFQTALIRTAQVMGTGVDQALEKYGTFRESLTKGQWLTAEVLTETLAQISGAYDESTLLAQGYSKEQAAAILQLADTAVGAATDVKTFTQLWDTLNESIGSGWAMTWQLIVGDFEEAKTFFTDLSDLFGPVVSYFSDARNDLLTGALSSNWEKMISQINEAGVETADFNEQLEKTVRGAVKNYDDLIERNGSLEAAFRSGELSGSLIIDTLKRMAGVTGTAGKATDEMSGKLEYFQKVVSDVWYGDYKNGEERVKALAAAGYDYAQVQALVNKTVDGHKLTLEDLSDAQLKAVGYTDEEVKALKELAKQAEATGTPLNELINNLTKKSGREYLHESIKNLVTTVINAGAAIGKAWQNIFPPMASDTLYNMVKGFSEFTASLANNQDAFNNIRRTFEGLFAILDLVTTILGGGFKLALTVIGKLLGNVDISLLDVTARLGDAAVALHDFILDNEYVNKGFEVLGDGIVTVAKAVKEWIEAFLDLPMVQSAIEKLKSTLSNLKDVGLDAIEGLKEGLQNGVTSIPEILMDIGRKILDAIKDVLGINSPSTEMRDIGEFTIEGFIEGVKSGAQTLYNTVKEVFSKVIDVVKDIFKDITFGDILAAAISVGLIVFTNRILNILDTVTAPLQGFADVLSGVGTILEEAAKPIAKVIKGVANVFNSFALTLKAKALKDIAIAIGILAASVFALAQLPSGQLWNSVGAIGALAVSLGLLTGGVGKFGGSSATQMAGMAAAFVGIGAALFLMSKSLSSLDKLNPDKLGQTLTAFAAMLIGMMALLAAMSKVASRSAGIDSAGLGFMMLELSASLWIMAQTIQILGSMSLSDLVQGSAVVIAFMGVMTLLALVSGVAGKSASGLGSMMVKLSVSLYLMVGVIKLFGSMNRSDLVVGMAVLTGFVGVITLMGIAARLAGPNASKFGTSLIAMSVSLYLLIGVVALLAKMNPEDIKTGMAALTGFVGIIGLMLLISKLAGREAPKIAGTILSMSLAVGVLAGIAVLLSLIDVEGLKRGITSVGFLSLFMTAMIAATKNTQSVTGNLVTITVAIGLMAAAVAGLSFIDPTRLLTATAAMTILMGMFAIVEKAGLNIQKSMGSLIVMTVAIGLLSGVLITMGMLPLEGTLEKAAALGLLMASLSASMLMISKTGKVNIGSTAALAGIAAILGVISAAILGVLAAMDIEPSIETALSLSTLILALSAATVLLGAAGSFSAGAASGAAGLLIVVAAVGALLTALGGLNELFDGAALDFINNGIPVLNAIASGLGQAVGNLISGLGVGLTSGLPAMAENLSTFMSTMSTGFAESVKAFDQNTLASVGYLTGAIIALTAAEFINGIGSLFGLGDFSSLGEKLESLGTSMKAFSDTLGEDFNSESVTAAAAAGEMLAKLNESLPREGGALQEFFGTTDFEQFNEDIVGFGNAIKDFSTIVDGKIKASAVEAAVNAGQMLADLNNSLPRSDGALQEFLGEQDFDEWSKKIIKFAGGIVAFSRIVDGQVSEEAVSAAANAGQMLADLNNNLPESDGILQDFLGEKDFTTWGVSLLGFGKGIVAFSKIVDGQVSEEAVSAAANAGQMLSDLNEKIPESGGFIQTFFGEKDFKEFGKQIVYFGYGLLSFSLSAAAMNHEAVGNAVDSAERLVDLSSYISENDDSILFFKDTSLTDFASNIKELGSGLKEFATSATAVDATLLSSGITQLSRLVTIAEDLEGLDTTGMSSFGSALTSLADADIEGMVSTYTNAYGTVKAAVKGLVDSMVAGVNTYQNLLVNAVVKMLDEAIARINGKKPEFSTAGGDLTKAITDGASSSDRETALTNAFVGLLDSILETIRQNGVSFEDAGKGLVERLVLGIGSKNSDRSLTNAFGTILSSMNTSIRNAYDDFYNSGRYLVQGFANGISENSYLATAKAKAMAKAADTTARNTLGVQSPSTVFYMIGEYVVEGFANGISDNTSKVEGASKVLGGIMIESTEDSLEVKGGTSELAKKVIGESFVNGIAEGITEDMSAEEAAEKKAQNIVDAFSNALEKIDFSSETLDLEQQLWDAQNENLKTDAQKDSAQLETLLKQYEYQQQRIELAKAEYQTMITEFGEQSQEAKESYNRLLQEQIDLADLSNQVIDLKDAEIERENDILDKRDELLEHQYQIWKNQNTANLEEEEKEKKDALADLALLTQQYEIQLARMQTAQSNYQAVLSMFGSNANETYEAYNSYLSEYESLSDLFSQLSAAREAQLEQDKDAILLYTTYMNANKQKLLSQGVDINDIQKYALTYASASGFNLNKIVSDMQKEVEGAISSVSSSIQKTEVFEALGSGVVSSLASGMQEALPEVVNSSNKVAETLGDTLNDSLGTVKVKGSIDDLSGSEDQFKNIGQDLLTSFYNGMTDATLGEEQGQQAQGPGIIAVFDRLFASLQEQFEDTYYIVFYNAGVEFILQLIAGMESETNSATAVAMNLMSTLYNRMYTYRTKFYYVGSMIIEAIVDAIYDNADDVRGAVIVVCRDAIIAARLALGINSPSKVFYGIGKYVMEGFARGIEENASLGSNAANYMAQQAINTTRDALSRLADTVTNGIDTEPTIRPVLDLSNVESGTRRISAMFSRNQAMSISSRMNPGAIVEPEIQNGVSNTPTGATYSFVQNNYSPKALSRIEIYRQTNNQFSNFVRRKAAT